MSKYGWGKYNGMTDEDVKNAFEQAPWIKAIIVYITTL